MVPDYSPTGWQETLFMWAYLALVLFFNSVLSKALPAIEIGILIIHILGFFAIFISILYLAPKATAADVFTIFNNGGGWPSQGLSFFVGLAGVAAAFIGADAAVHMSEEIRRASINVPRSMVFSTFFNGMMALALIIAFLFSAGTISEDEAEAIFPYIPILARVMGSNTGAAILISLIIVLQFCACLTTTATASRMLWAFARDRGLPGWQQLIKIDARSTIPLRCLIVGVTLAALFALINIGSSAVFNDIISLGLGSLSGTYILSCSLLLYRRVRGEIGEERALSQKPFTWGPWHIKGGLGIVINICALMYLSILFFFGFWPSMAAVEAATMNYGSLLFGAALIWSIAYYIIWAHKSYRGPVREVGALTSYRN
ncbi:MAG: hypothetical protein LQ340_002786 [Diploschistes diacapsis]|nr:MAG: hypothetical protein LQ340_002786 [Diploschistes diacapsis]